MGWTTTCTYRGGGIRRYLDAEFTSDDPEFPRWEILKSAMKGMTEYYAALRRTDRVTGATLTFALVVLVSYKPRDPDGYTLGWKEMDESMGPTIINCPGSLLDLLDPPTNDNARLWRDSCRGREARLKRTRDLLSPGTRIELVDALRFANGQTYSRFTVERPRRALRFRADDGTLCSIQAVENLDWFILADGTESADR